MKIGPTFWANPQKCSYSSLMSTNGVGTKVLHGIVSSSVRPRLGTGKVGMIPPRTKMHSSVSKVNILPSTSLGTFDYRCFSLLWPITKTPTGNIALLHQFPTKGLRNRPTQSHEQSRKITYTCKPPHQERDRCLKPGVAAFRMTPYQFNEKGWAIVFCDLFFQQRSLNNLTDSTPTSVDHLESLKSHESLLAHEILHCDIIGTKRSIEDKNGIVSGQSGRPRIYGAKLCHEWAWAYNKSPKRGPINVETALNADNYAWFLTHRWFYKHWKWNDYVGGSWFGSLEYREMKA